MKLIAMLVLCSSLLWAKDKSTKDNAPFYAGPWTTLEGKKITLFTDGKPVLMDFWASWCVACRMATPHITAIGNDIPNLRIIGVNVEEGDLADAHKFVEITKMKYPSIVDIPDRLSTPLQIEGLPSIILFDAKGKILKRWLGEPEDLGDSVRQALGIE